MKVFSIPGIARAAGLVWLFAGLAMPSAFAIKDPAVNYRRTGEGDRARRNTLF